MDTQDERKTCIVEKPVNEKSTEHNKPWLSLQDNGTLMSAAVKLMLSVVVSSTVSALAFLLKYPRPYYYLDTLGNIYVAVILLWVALMSLIFFTFMWNRVLKDKAENIKACFAFGMAVNVLVVFATAISACASYQGEIMVAIVLFIGVFNSMVMLMFHDTKAQKEEEKRKKIYEYMRPTFEIPKGIEVSVEKEQGK